MSLKKIRNETLIPGTKGINLKNIIQSERSQNKRLLIVWFHICEMSKKGKSKKTEKLISICLELEVRMGVKSK